ncbi:hypothetical protein BaRGS_00000720, partial [Batillaria attramentaria]
TGAFPEQHQSVVVDNTTSFNREMFRCFLILLATLSACEDTSALEATCPPSIQQVFLGDQSQVTDFAAELADLQNKYTTLEAKFNAASKVVAFYVRISADTTTLAAKGNLIYDVIVTNIGDGYDSSTGQFTAPVSGTYVFLVNCMAADSLFQELVIFLDGQRVAGCVSHRPATKEWDLGTSFLTVHLNAGQKVWTKNWSSGATQIRGADWQTFSGFLISADE